MSLPRLLLLASVTAIAGWLIGVALAVVAITREVEVSFLL